MADPIEHFASDGYAVVEAVDRRALDCVRTALIASCPGLQGDDSDAKLNRFHERGIEGAALNDYRLGVYRRFNSQVDAGKLIWQAFRDQLLRLVGPDVAVQQRVNLVIQPPSDSNQSPVHRDAPPNSLFEVVVWLPLVDCYGTKGMRVLNRSDTDAALRFLEGQSADYEAFTKFAMSHGEAVSVPYGSALLFWTRCVHAIPVNTESETRWSLNLRYKSVFTPYGTKGLPDYFRILELSPLSRLAIEEERQHRLATSAQVEPVTA